MELGACKYCGAVIMGEYPQDATDETKIAIATANCKCEEAESERLKLQEIKRAKLRISELFGEKSNKLGFNGPIENRDIHKMLENAVDMVSDHTIRGITVDVGNNTKAKIVMSSDKINVERSQNIKYKLQA